MSQNPLMDSGTRSPKISGLNPALAAALGSLEVQLDQELARYRRSRMGIRATSKPSAHSYVSSPSPEVTTHPSPIADTPFPTLEISNYLATIPVPETPKAPPATPPIIKETPEHHAVAINSESHNQIPLPPPQAASSLVPATTQTTPQDKLLANDAPSQPDDYLESSEALLRSLTDEQSADNQPTNSGDSLLSPLGIGSILLLLLASLTLGYVVFNPKSLPQFNLSKLLNNNPPANNTNSETVSNQSQPQPELTPIPKYPNLAAKEFPEVKDPNDIVGLQPKIVPTPLAPSNPLVVSTPLLPPATNPLSQVQPLPPADLSPTLQPSPSTTTTPTQTNAEIKPAADGRYYIVAENQDASTLAAARQVVSDAYLSSNQKLIYLGALTSKEEAQQRIKQLQAKGVKARVQQP
ncbi:hypothetical protein [Nostoc sp. CMAA1605]|uniref:hypothetical protein n=1 Tax=Nostoc sp. CMAA1605 TaxID=2055159 RepID=UPI001F2C192F|nr:hypothetical protein [Nostoc sp. CMAA1605]MCF4966126.1 hypothetical protein [Nostoc sp. CMAA1605]